MDFTLTDTQQHIQSQARAFAQDRVAPLAREMDEKGEMPLSLVGEMAAVGHAAMTSGISQTFSRTSPSTMGGFR